MMPFLKVEQQMLLKQCLVKEQFQIIILTKLIPLFLLEQTLLGDWQGGFEKGYAASRNPDSGHMSYLFSLRLTCL